MSNDTNKNRLACPNCKQENDPTAEYCWQCFFDFKPDVSPGSPKKDSLGAQVDPKPLRTSSVPPRKDTRWLIPIVFVAFQCFIVVMFLNAAGRITVPQEKVTAYRILATFVGITSLFFWFYWRKIRSVPVMDTTSEGIFTIISKSRSIREFQDNVVNNGWRIKMIPFDDPAKPMKVQTNGIALIFAVIFLISMVMSIKTKDQVYMAGLFIGVIGMAIAVLKKGRERRANWVKVWAQCVDKELRCIFARSSNHGAGYIWEWRWVCEFDYGGRKYQVTPKYLGIRKLTLTPPPREEAEKFDQQVVQGGNMELLVNPDNPLQTELADNTVANQLLH